MKFALRPPLEKAANTKFVGKDFVKRKDLQSPHHVAAPSKPTKTDIAECRRLKDVGSKIQTCGNWKKIPSSSLHSEASLPEGKRCKSAGNAQRKPKTSKNQLLEGKCLKDAVPNAKHLIDSVDNKNKPLRDTLSEAKFFRVASADAKFPMSSLPESKMLKENTTKGRPSKKGRKSGRRKSKKSTRNKQTSARVKANYAKAASCCCTL